MTKTLRTFLAALILCLTIALGLGVSKLIEGSYFSHASFITSVVVAASIVLIAGVFFYLIKKIWLGAFFLLLFPLLESCNYAKSNQQVLISSDCGMNWKLIPAGDAVPKGIGNYCFMKVVIPNYPMQGESKFISNFKDRVRVKVNIDYDYSITNGLAFMKQAKRLGASNADPDSNEALNDSAFESAENSVIDVRIRDISKAITLNEDIVDLDQGDLETKLLSEVNRTLDPLGVHLNFITLTFDLDEQTRQAIDVATAMRIYETKGIGDLGRQVITARAGATKVVVENQLQEKQRAEE